MIRRLSELFGASPSSPDSPRSAPLSSFFPPHGELAPPLMSSTIPGHYLPPLKPYEVPDPSGKCWLFELPDEAINAIFTSLDRVNLTRCFRLCKRLHDSLSSSSPIQLHHALMCNSLTVNPLAIRPPSNPHAPVPTSASILSTLRERITRLRHFRPKTTNEIPFEEAEGRLYEYLEGILLRGISPTRRAYPREMAVYDLRKVSEWEDMDFVETKNAEGDAAAGQEEVEEGKMVIGQEEEEDEEEERVRRIHKFDFELAEFAVDPGQDLLVVTEVRASGIGAWRMHFHLLTLSTAEPHPSAGTKVLEWPNVLSTPDITLSFQICDDGFFVMKHRPNRPNVSEADHVVGWQWTTGRQAMTLRAFETMRFESFVLLSPSAFVVPTIVVHTSPDELNVMPTWSHHLYLYAFPPFSAIQLPKTKDIPMPPPHTPIHCTTLDLPDFTVDLDNDIPPCRLSVRSDPPPRHTLPTHPTSGSIPAFQPTPDSGIIIVGLAGQIGNIEFPAYSIIIPKPALLRYLPAPTSPLLFAAFPRPAPVVQWNTLAPRVRMFGPWWPTTSWVCYVYQNRLIMPWDPPEDYDPDDEPALMREFPSDQPTMRLFDFDPLRVRKEIKDREYELPPAKLASNGEDEDDDMFDFEFRPRKRRAAGGPAEQFRQMLRDHGFSGAARQGDWGKMDGRTKSIEGERQGVTLVTSETVLEKRTPLAQEVRTGSQFPYMFVEKETMATVALLDGERIAVLHEPTLGDDSDDDMVLASVDERILEVWDF